MSKFPFPSPPTPFKNFQTWGQNVPQNSFCELWPHTETNLFSALKLRNTDNKIKILLLSYLQINYFFAFILVQKYFSFTKCKHARLLPPVDFKKFYLPFHNVLFCTDTTIYCKFFSKLCFEISWQDRALKDQAGLRPVGPVGNKPAQPLHIKKIINAGYFIIYII